MLQLNTASTLKTYPDHYGELGLLEMARHVNDDEDLDYIEFVQACAAHDFYAAYLVRAFARALRHFMELDRMIDVLPEREMRGEAFRMITADRCDAIDIMDALLMRIVRYAVEE